MVRIGWVLWLRNFSV